MKHSICGFLRAFTCILFLLGAVFGHPASAQTFVHPGALNSQADFDRIKAKVAAGEWPWYDSYLTLCNDGLTSLGWWWGPVAQITRGGGGGNNFSRSQKDAIAIYCLALRYRISGDTRYADKAIQGMDAWSSTMTAGPNGDNWGLAAGLCGYEFAVAGETLRGYPGWSQTSINNYKSFLGYFANSNIQFLNSASLSSRSNWLTDNAASLAACGVFADNTDWFNQAINYYKYGHTNGQVHIWAWFMHPMGITQMEESGRDQAHVQDALSSMAALCEIADHQGIDLYGYDNNRVLRAAEYFAKFNSWLDVPYTAYYNNGGWTKDHWETNLGYGGRGAFQPVWDMLNAHYYKQGIYAPYTAGYAASHRPSGNVGNWNSPDVFGYDTLTHYQTPPVTDVPPSGLLANFSSRQATLSWFGSPRATSYNVKRSTVKGGPYTTIATTDAMTVNYVDNQIPRGPTYYYVVSAMTPSGETANSPEAIGSGCATRYDFEGDASDSVGTFSGTLACSGTNGLPGFTGGHGGGQAIMFNGLNQYVQLPFGAFTYQDMTVSAWINWSGGAAWQRVFDTGDPNRNRNMYLTVSDGSRMRFYISDGWHDYDATLYGPVPSQYTWMHVAVTIRAGTVTLYQNGVAVDSKPVGTFPLFGQTYSYIGKSLANDPYFSGAIDDFRIYNGALSSSEIYALGSSGTNHAPHFASDPMTLPAAWDSVPYAGHSLFQKATDVDGGPLTFTKLSGPAWLNVAGNGELSGTPGQNDVGLETFNVRVTDASGASDDATVYINVNNTNQAPTWNSGTITKPLINQNEPYSYVGASLSADATDPDLPYGDTLSFSKVSGPSWLTVAANGALSGTPGAGDAGLNTFTVRVTDANGLSSDATLNITVAPYSLRSQYQLEGNLNDSISGYNGTANGSPTYVAGYNGQGISLNGSTDFITLPAAAANSPEITVAAWVYWNGGSNNQRVFDFGNSTSQYLELCPNTGSGMRVEMVNSGTVQQINYATPLPTGRWVHVAVALSGSVGTLYVNGTAVASNTTLTIKPTDFNPQINYVGKSQWSADPLWNGKMDDFRIYNYALSASDISSLIGSVAPLTPTGLTANGGNGLSQVSLSWSASVGATSYNVKRATSPNGPYTTIYSGSTTSFVDATGTPGVIYYYIVTAVDAGGESTASSSVAQLANGSAPRVYLRMDEASGSTASDSSGNGWNGTLVGGTTWAAGKINNAVSLSGATNYVTFASGVVTSMTNCTISAWVKVNSMSTWGRIFDFGTGTTNYMFLAPSSGASKARFAIRTPSIAEQQISSSTIVSPTGVWTHFAVTLSGSVGTLYINGTSAGTNSAMTLNPTSLGTTTQNYIGKSQWNDPYLNGLVDEFQIYARALSPAEIATLATSIPAPTGVNISAGDAQATLTWNSVPNATGYNVKRSGTSGGPYTLVQANLSGTTWTDSSLINSTGYFYVVTALNGVAESAKSSEVTTTPVGAPPVPTGLQATGTISQVSLTWTPSYGATSYSILRSTTSGTGYALSGTSATASFSDTTVTNGTTYYYVINAVGPNGQSANSSEASATPLPLPAAPSGLVANGDSDSIILTWNASPFASSYNVKRTTTSGSNYTVLATTGSTSFDDTTIAIGTTYYYVVSAVNAMGEGSNSVEVSGSPVVPPSAPTITASAGNGLVAVQWGAVSGATSYSVKRSGTSGGPYALISTGTATSYFDTSVTNGSSYYYVVTASNSGGESPASAQALAKPSANVLRTYLRFDELTGSFAGDSTGNGWNGTITGANTWAAGKINNAVSLSGTTNYVSLPSALMTGVTDYTISAWVKLNTSVNNTRVFDIGNGTSSYMELCPKNGNNGFLRYEIVSSGTVQQINSSAVFPVGVWTHVAVTQSGSTGTLYLNGTSVGTNAALTLKPANLGVTALNYIGKSQWGSDPYLNGLVDEFQVYGRALTASEIGFLANPLAAPASLTATAGYSQITCNWSTVAGATSYNLKRSYTSGGPYTTLATLTGTTFTDTSTVPESPYYYVVTSGSGLVESANSTQQTATPLMAAPVISSTTAASGTNGSAFSYQITATNIPTSFGATGVPSGLSVNSSNGILSGIPTVTGTYSVSISASNDAGTSNGTLTLVIQPPAPVISSGLSITGTSGSAFNYSIAASNSPTSFAATGLPPGLSVNTTSGVISGTPSVSGTFSVTLSASNGAGTGSATLQILMLSGSFGAPTGLGATAGVNAATLAWTPVAGASSYNVKRSLTSGSGYTTVATGLASPAYSDTGLTNRTTYYYVVTAVTSGGTESANSSEVGVTPMPALTWTGGGSDANWLTAGNWSSQPVAGDPLSFEGNLRLSNTNNYSVNTQFGGITFNSGAGAFALNGNAVNLAGDIVNNSGTAQTISLNLALMGANRTINPGSSNITLAGMISQSGGTYGLIKTGTGSLTLSGTNTFAGGVVLNQGFLNAESHSALGTGTLTLAGGTLRNSTSNGGTRVLANPVLVSAGAASFVRAVAADFVLNGNITGSGTLDICGLYNGAGMRLSGSNSGFTGTVNVSGPNLRLDTPDSGSANAAWIVGVSGTGGLELNASGTSNTFQLGSLSGNGCIEGHFIFSSPKIQTLSIGALGTDSAFSGSIIDNAVNNPAFGNGDGAANNVLALTKVGAGTLTLSGTNPYSGPTIVNAGTLKLNGILSGTSAVTVNSGGALAGSGTSSGPVTVTSGGAIAPGDSGAGTLTVNGLLTLNDASILNVQLSGTGASDQIILGSGLVTTGTTTLNIAALSGFGEGTYPLITGTAAISAANFVLGTVPAGYACSLSATNGVLSVTTILLPLAPTGLSPASGDTIVNLSWNTTATATSYNVKRSVTSGSGYVTIASGTSTSFSDTGLTNGTTYYYVVSAVNAGGEGPNSSEASARPLPPVPVISSAATASGTTGIAFSYAITASSSPTSYAATGLPAGLNVNTSTGIISGTPSASGTFNVTLSATNLGGTGTAPLTLTVFPPAPVITSAASASGTNGTAFSYTITATNTPSSFAATGLPTGLTLDTSTGVINGTPTVTGTFTASLTASNWGGTGSANLVLSIAMGIPGTPTGLTAAGSSGAVALNWSAASQAATYNVKRSLTSGSGYTTIASGVTATSYNDTAVTNWTTYYYVVSAVNAQGESANSSEVNATPMPPDTWIGAGSDNYWQTAANWSTLPVEGDTLFFAGTTRLSDTNNYSANTAFTGVAFNSGAGAFALSGNAITLQGDIVNNSTNTQTLNLGIVLTGSSRAINTATGNITISGPIAESGGSYGLIKTGSNTLTLSGSSTFSGGVSHGVGTISVASSGGSNYGPLGTGTLSLAGGTLNNSGATAMPNISNPIAISGTLSKIMVTANQNFQLNGTVSGSAVATLGGGSAVMSLYINGTNAMTSGTVIVANGNNSIRILNPNFGNPAIAWVFNNTTANRETLDFTTGTISFGSMTGAGIVQGNNSTGTKTISVGALGYNETFSGVIQNGAGTVALIKTGSGTFTMSGNSSYSGGATINSGVLKVTGTLSGAGGVSVSSGATLTGIGSVAGTTTVANGASLAPGDNGTGTLNLSGLTLNDGAVLNIELSGTGSSDKIAASGAISTSGTTTINFTALSGFGPGTYPLISGTSVLNASNFTVGTAPSGYGYALSASSGVLSVTVVAPPSAPTGVTATAGDSVVNLAWTAGSGAGSYNVKRSLSSGGTYTTIANGVTSLTYSDTTAINGTTYYYVVSSVNLAGESTNSTEGSAMPVPPVPVITSASSATANNGGAFSYSISATNSPTNFGATGLPTGLSVNTATGVISGTSTATGSYNTTISATNLGGTGSASLVITVLPPPPVVTSAATASGTTGVTFSYAITASNSPTSFVASGLPTGLSNDTSTGVISGTPTTAGTSTVTISASNAGGTGSATLTITVVPPAPVITSGLSTSGTTGVAFSYSIAATNSPTSYAASGLPAGLSVNTSTGLISGTPSATGTTNVTISASNAGGTGSATLTITVVPPAPVITSGLSASGTTGVAFSYSIAGTNSPTSYAASGLPAGLSVDTGTGLISGTPSATGTTNVTISATNAGGTGSATLTITVVPPAPVITSGLSASGTTGVVFSYSIAGTNSPTSYAASGLPAGLSVDTGTGLISGTPGATGTTNVTISASNAGGTGSATLTITVVPPAPVITSGLSASGTTGVAFSYSIAGTNSPTSYAASGLPAGLSVNTSTGLISGTPSATGTTNVTISASNAGGTGSATLGITVVPPAPVITSAAVASGTYGSAFSYTITASNSPTSFGATGLPAGLNVNTSTGLISGTPVVTGTYSATISATNAGGTGSGLLTITLGSLVNNTWTGGGANALWQNSANWTTLPAAGSPLVFAGSLQLSNTNDIAAGTQFASMTFNSGAGAFVLGGNAITLAGDIVNNSTSAQTINTSITLSGARTFNAANGNLVLGGAIGGASIGTVTISGTNTVTLSGANTFNTKSANFSALIVTGNLSVTGSTTVDGTGFTDFRGYLDQHGTSSITVQSGGSLAINTSTGSGLNSGIGNNAAGTSTLTLNGGSFSINGNGGFMVGNNLATATGVLTISSGTATFIRGSTTATDNRSFIAIGRDSANGTINLNGGVLATDRNFVRDGNGTANGGTASFNFGGGTLKALANQTDWLNSSLLNTNQQALSSVTATGTSTIDANGFSVAINSAISGAGGFNINSSTGTGTVTFGGTSTYTGATLINGGVFNLTGAITGSSAVLVNSGGTLAGTGTVAGATTVSGGGAIAPGNGGAGTLSLGGLTLNDGAVLNLELSGTGTSDKVAVAGAVTASGTTTINLTALTGFGSGTYPLISGTAVLNSGNFKVGTAPAGYGYTLSASSGALSVTVVALPSAPTGVTATAGNASANLAWTASSGATSYNVKRSLASGGGFTLVASGTATSYTDSGLTNGTAYYYVVSASNSAGEGANSTQASAVPTNNTSLPRFSLSGDIGTTGATGTTSLASGTYTMQGAGADIAGTADAFQSMYQQVTGDCDVRVRVTSVQNTNAGAKAGVMIRNTLDAGSAFADMVVTPGSGVFSQWRATASGTCASVQTTGPTAPYWVRLVRSGSNFISYSSADGATWSTSGTTAIAMNSTVYVGLAVTSHVSGTLCTATMTNFSIVSLPSPWSSSDVGTVGSAGSAIYSGSTYTIAGSGVDISGTSDAFRYAYQTSTGDCDITARVSDMSVTNASAKAAVMVRESLNANSIHAMVVVTPSSGISLQWRSTTGGSTSTTAGPSVTAPYWIRLVRSGSTFTGYYSVDGTTWTSIGSTTITMASSANMGLGVTSHSDGVLCTASLDNVTANP